MPNHIPLAYTKKINYLDQRGYLLVGDLPENLNLWKTFKIGVLLFIKNNEYYQCNTRYLFSEDILNFDEHNEPVFGSYLSKIGDQSFIYIIINEKASSDHPELRIILLRHDAKISGHGFLAGPYMNAPNAFVAAGEIYYEHGRPILINPKSGSFRNTISAVIDSINVIFGEVGKSVFYAGVEEEEVQTELNRRKNIIESSAVKPMLPSDLMQTSTSLYVNSQNTLFTNLTSSECPPPKTASFVCSCI